MGADRVVAVNLKSTWSNVDRPRHIFDVIGQCFSIAQDMNCTQARTCADLVIDPDVTGYRYDDFEHSAELVRIGEETARAALPQILKWFEVIAADVVKPSVAKRATTSPVPTPAVARP